MTVPLNAPPVVVQKYGGTSVATPERIRAIAERVGGTLCDSPRLVVVLSAMGKTTDELVALAHEVSDNPGGREMDLLLATGEQVSVSLLGLALQHRGIPAVSLTASQCGIRTDDAFNIARIESIDTRRILAELDRERVVIITGFQGITRDHEVTTLGRGGSDITGAAVAAALEASVCEICTDVDGVLSADPRAVPHATRWREISYEEAIEMASSGAKVLHPRAAEVCMAYRIPIHVRSSFHDGDGTWIRGGDEMVMEQAAVVGVSSDRKIAKVTLIDVPDRPGSGCGGLSRSGCPVDQRAADHSGRERRGPGPHHVCARRRVREWRHASGRGLEVAWSGNGRSGGPQRREDLDRRIAPCVDARSGCPHVRGARARRHQHRLHQLFGDEDRLRDWGHARGRGGPGRPRRVLSGRRDGAVRASDLLNGLHSC